MRPLRERSNRAGYRHSWDLGALAAGGVIQYDETNAHILPGLEARGDFNGLAIVNNSDADIHADPDYFSSRRIIVLAHSAQALDNLVPFQTLNITNASTTTAISAGQVWITVRNERDVLRESV